MVGAELRPVLEVQAHMARVSGGDDVPVWRVQRVGETRPGAVRRRAPAGSGSWSGRLLPLLRRADGARVLEAARQCLRAMRRPGGAGRGTESRVPESRIPPGRDAVTTQGPGADALPGVETG